MRLHITTKRVERLSSFDKHLLICLSSGKTGMMSPCLNTCSKARCIIAYYRGKIIGWGIIVRSFDRHYHFMVYVNPHFRRKGVGTSIAKRAHLIRKRSFDRNFCVYRNDRRAEKFFSSLNTGSINRWRDV